MNCNHKWKYVEETIGTKGYSECIKCDMVKGSKEYWYEQFKKQNELSGSSASSYYVAVLPCASGNAEVGTMWRSTKIINGETTITELFEWVNTHSSNIGDLTITKP